MAIRRANNTITEKLYDNLLHESEVIIIVLRTLFLFFLAAMYFAGINLFPPDKVIQTLAITSILNIVVILQYYVFKNGVLRRLLTLLIDFGAISVLIINNFNVTVRDSSIFYYAYVLLIIVAALWFSVSGSIIMSFIASVTILFIAYLQGGGPNATYIIADTLLFQVTFLFVIGVLAGYVVDIQIREREHNTRYMILLAEYEKRYKNSSNLYRELLPKEFLEIPGYEMYAKINPVYDEGGGDIYYMEKCRNDEENLLLIADVTGKDARGVYKLSLFILAVKTAFRIFCDFEKGIKEINKIVFDSFNEESFVAATFINIKKDIINISNCGNEYPVLIKSSGEITELSGNNNLLLGIDEQMDVDTMQVCMESGDVLAFCTDGITEARDVNGREIENEMVITAMRDALLSGASAQELCDVSFLTVEEFSKNTIRKDDMTVMVIKKI